MMAKENHLDDVKNRMHQLRAANLVLNIKENAFIKKTAGVTYYMPFVDIETMSDEKFNEFVSEASKSESIGGEIEDEPSQEIPQEEKRTTLDNPQAVIESEVLSNLNLQKSLEDMQNELMQNEKFRQFLELSKTVPAQIEATWKRIESAMIENNIKSLKGDYGTITIVERIGWNCDPTILPPEFFKRVVDTKKLTDVYVLEGEAPKGATPKYNKYLMKRLK